MVVLVVDYCWLFDFWIGVYESCYFMIGGIMICEVLVVCDFDVLVFCYEMDDLDGFIVVVLLILV